MTTLQSEAAQLTREMTLEQLQVGGYEQQSRAASAQAASDANALAQTQAAITRIRHRLADDQSKLRHSAVTAYMDAGNTPSDLLFASPSTSGSSEVYEQVLTGSLGGAMAQLHADRRTLATEEATEQQLAAQDAQAVNQANALLTDAQSTEASLQTQNANINAQLATAIAQQQQQEAAAAAAQRAATAAATAASTPAAVPAPTGSAAPAATASVTPGGLPPFLVCVLQAESGGDYQAVSPTGGYMGGFQFSQTTWNHAAILAGLATLVGVAPYNASPGDQNALAIALYDADGEQPWYDPCRT